MKDKIREEIRLPYYQQNFPNDGQRFVAWYLRNIHLKDMNEAKDCITDGADDKQIDAIVIDYQLSTVTIIQGKFFGKATVDAEPLREVLSSWVHLRDLAKLQEGANQKLKVKLSEVATALSDDCEVVFELITTSSLSESARHDLAAFQNNLGRDENFPATLHLVDENELERRHRLALEQGNPSIEHAFALEHGKYTAMHIGGTQVVLAAIQLTYGHGQGRPGSNDTSRDRASRPWHSGSWACRTSPAAVLDSRTAVRLSSWVA